MRSSPYLCLEEHLFPLHCWHLPHTINDLDSATTFFPVGPQTRKSKRRRQWCLHAGVLSEPLGPCWPPLEPQPLILGRLASPEPPSPTRCPQAAALEARLHAATGVPLRTPLSRQHAAL